MKLVYKRMPQWPPLTWLAECTPQCDTVTVFVGGRIEANDEWFCEAVWDGDFAAGDFDKTEIVAGSGGRLRGDNLYFISAGSNVDRLHALEKDGVSFVSNSLVCLLTWLDADPDLHYFNYGADFAKYNLTMFGEHTIGFPCSVGQLKLTYVANLLWSDGGLSESEKNWEQRAFDSYENYLGFMRKTMSSIAENAVSKERNYPYKILCPLSNGYDSPAVAALARDVEGIEAFTFSMDRQGENDSGEQVAEALGMPCHVVDRDAWQKSPKTEVPFIAASGSIGDLAFKGAETMLNGALVLTGYGGDTLWEKEPEQSDPVIVGSGSMIGLSEYRLWCGFISIPVALWGVNQMSDIVRLSALEEMRPWDVGGNYNRPISRRIVESAGVARGLFGDGKRGVSVAPSVRNKYLNPGSLEDLLLWLREKRGQGHTDLPHPAVARFLDQLITPLAKLAIFFQKTVRRRRLRLRWLLPFANWLVNKLTGSYYHHKYVIHWAIDRAKSRYKHVG